MPVPLLRNGATNDVPAVEPTSAEVYQPSKKYTRWSTTPTLSVDAVQARLGPVAVTSVIRRSAGMAGGVVSPVDTAGVTTVTEFDPA
jgi:hypothetical protein